MLSANLNFLVSSVLGSRNPHIPVTQLYFFFYETPSRSFQNIPLTCFFQPSGHFVLGLFFFFFKN